MQHSSFFTRTVCFIFITLMSPLFAAPVNLQLANAALQRTHVTVQYDGAYRQIAYPNGDVPADTGVCTDVIIRSYRALGIDLQQRVHEDMKLNFSSYPSKRIWGLTRPDTNIDHRRVPNLQTYFSRFGRVLTLSHNASDYRIGDIVTWMLPGNLPHIGIVASPGSNAGDAPLIVHNIGRGPQLENVLFAYRLSGHYRFLPVATE